MAVSIDLDITHNSYNPSTNSSSVTVILYLNWDSGSYNGYDPAGILYIDGISYNFNCSFNAGQTSNSGRMIATSETVTIQHNSDGTKNLYCSAIFYSGVSSGNVSTSGSMTLTGTPGGGTGGGEDDGYYCEVQFALGEHMSVSIGGGTPFTTSRTLVYEWSGTVDQIPYSVTVTLDDGYELGTCTEAYDGRIYNLNISGSSATFTFYAFDTTTLTKGPYVITLTSKAIDDSGDSGDTGIATGSKGIYLYDGSGYSLYQSWIDNGSKFNLYIPWIDLGTSWVEIAPFKATITVNYSAGAYCYCSNGEYTLMSADTSGSCTFTVYNAGDWNVYSNINGAQGSSIVSITENNEQASTTLSYTMRFITNGNLTKTYTTNADISASRIYTPINGVSTYVYRFLTTTNNAYVQFSNNIINADNYNKLVVECACNDSGDGSIGAVGLLKTDISIDSSPGFTCVAPGVTTAGKKTYTLDLSSLSGNYYVTMKLQGLNTVKTLLITNLYLE